jgi:hypothetical protein
MVTSPKLKERASKLLADPATTSSATPALRVAYDLRMATSCAAKKPLLERAAEHGDKRSVAVLSPLVVSTERGCGFLGLRPCVAPCATIAAEIKETIAAIEARGARRAE